MELESVQDLARPRMNPCASFGNQEKVKTPLLHRRVLYQIFYTFLEELTSLEYVKKHTIIPNLALKKRALKNYSDIIASFLISMHMQIYKSDCNFYHLNKVLYI